MENEAYQQLVKKLDAVYAELKRLQDPVSEMSREWIDTYDVMKILNVSRRTLTKYLQSGRLQYSKIENRNFFRLRDVEKFLQEHHHARSRSNYSTE